MRSRIIPIAHKEFLHIVRDWRSLSVAVVLPMILVIIFGYAITFDIKHIRLVVCDGDNTPESRSFVRRLTSGGYFALVGYARDPSGLQDYLDRGLATIAVNIPKDFSSSVALGRPPVMQVLVDGSENNTASIAIGYLSRIAAGYSLEMVGRAANRSGLSLKGRFPPVETRTRVWYNQELRSQDFVVPGVIVVVMMIMTALLTAMTVVREREQGTLEQIIVTPVKPYELMVGKLVPYFVIGMVDALLVILVGLLVFDIPFRGSFLLLIGFTALFALAGLGIGLTISTVASSQLFAMQLALLTTLLPSFLLSGFVFAIKEMPAAIQALTYIIPARYYLVILRGIFLKGAGVSILWGQAAILAVFGLVFLFLSSRRFKKRLD